MKIAIMGAGAFGTALGGILANNGYDIDYYDSKVEKERLGDVLKNAKIIVLCVPSKAAPHLLPYLPKNKPLVVATKGILTEKMFDNFKDVMVLSGPGFASDIKAKKTTELTVTDGRLLELFAAPHLRFDQTGDRQGVLMCGALKNVYAIGAGMRKLIPGSGESKKYLTAAAEEMKILLALNGADPATVDLVCGKGDLKLTCAPQSRNYTYGWKLADNPDYLPEETVEGLSALHRIRQKEIMVPKNLPILENILETVCN